MKKICFVLAFMIFGSFGFSSPKTTIVTESELTSEKISESSEESTYMLCRYDFDYYNSDGEVLTQGFILWESSSATTQEECTAEFNAWLFALSLSFI